MTRNLDEPVLPEITPEMIAAGAAELASADHRFEGDEDIVERIYRAMLRASVRKIASSLRDEDAAEPSPEEIEQNDALNSD